MYWPLDFVRFGECSARLAPQRPRVHCKMLSMGISRDILGAARDLRLVKGKNANYVGFLCDEMGKARARCTGWMMWCCYPAEMLFFSAVYSGEGGRRGGGGGGGVGKG